jgi:phosphoenolpyruvate synthase/pyruvate phosphate dikinase
LVKSLREIDLADVAMVGGKGAGLGALIATGVRVPRGFVLTTPAFRAAIQKSAVGARRVGPTPRAVVDALASAVPALRARSFAVRSSANLEDGAESSWAGQLHTSLNVTSVDIVEAVRKCWASAFAERTLAYARDRRTRDLLEVAVVVQVMVPSTVAGTAFSLNPVTEVSEIVIEAVYGLGEAAVSGAVRPDTYRVDKKRLEIVEYRPHQQERCLRAMPAGGVQWAVLEKRKRSRPVLSRTAVRRIAASVRQLEKAFGYPVDVEWAIARERIFVLQCRPITGLSNQPRRLKR